jgi:tetratricopeptide (TPR) repeat protein
MRKPGPVLFGALVLLGVLTPACHRTPDLALSKKFQEAQRIFNAAASPEDFLKAAALYQQILEQGCLSGSVLYNLGNAYMQADQRGLAISAYRQAMRLKPRDAFLKANLEFALGPDAVLKDKRTVLDHLFFWLDLVSYPEKWYLTSLFVGLSLVFALGALFQRNRAAWNRLLWLALILTLLAGASAGLDWYRFEYIKHGVVTSDDTLARKGTSENYEPAFTQPLSEGTEFQVLEERGGWILIRMEEGPEGWIPGSSAVVY